jgi:hypothetical protein
VLQIKILSIHYPERYAMRRLVILAHQEILADHPELELNITEVGDADSIGKYATVLVLPTLVINEQVVCSGRHAGKYEIAEWLLNAMKGNDHVEP